LKQIENNLHTNICIYLLVKKYDQYKYVNSTHYKSMVYILERRKYTLT